jgi:hypothetical protein
VIRHADGTDLIAYLVTLGARLVGWYAIAGVFVLTVAITLPPDQLAWAWEHLLARRLSVPFGILFVIVIVAWWVALGLRWTWRRFRGRK